MSRPQLSVVLAVGTTQTLACASSVYLPAILAHPIAHDLGVSANWIFWRLLRRLDMDNQPQDNTVRRFLRWATTPPQAYAIYLACLALVWVLSFYAGTLRPKKTEATGPPPVAAPQR